MCIICLLVQAAILASFAISVPWALGTVLYYSTNQSLPPCDILDAVSATWEYDVQVVGILVGSYGVYAFLLAMAEVWLDVMDEWSRRVFNLIDAVSAAGSSATPRRIQCKTDEDEGIDDGPRCCVCAEARADCLLVHKPPTDGAAHQNLTGHLVVCCVCAKTQSTVCPMCRVPVQQVITIRTAEDTHVPA